MNWHDRFKKMKQGMGYTNKDIAEITGNTYESVRTVTSKKNKLPRWIKLSIVIFEQLNNNQ